MKMSEFTHGKWEVAPDGCVILPNGKWYLPCRTLDSKTETMANARLIAAAPEMYEAISECTDTLEAIHLRDDCHEAADLYEIEELLHSLWELLARIDGEVAEHE